MQCYLYPPDVLVSASTHITRARSLLSPTDHRSAAGPGVHHSSACCCVCADIVVASQAQPPSVTERFAFRDERVNRAFSCQLVNDAALALGLSASDAHTDQVGSPHSPQLFQ